MTDKELAATQKRILARGNLPRHVAIIMDGNGRWAKRRGLPRIAGHRAGITAVREAVEGCANLGVGYLTLYTFSVENWNRPATEVRALMAFLRQTLRNEVRRLDDNNVRLRAIGRIGDLPDAVTAELARAEDSLRDNTGLTLVLALSYGGRAEILDAVARITRDGGRAGAPAGHLTEEGFRSYLYAGDVPDPDLLIRTSGEMRISNFLIWQTAYSEIWVTDVLWPDFRRKHLYQGIVEYQKRERRFGGISAAGKRGT
jgi:undecaprenyl diphosphate synthase